MAILQTTKLKEGMVLSEDVKDINGRLLLGKGKKIESNHIRMLKMWGITEVDIVGKVDNEAQSEPHEDPELIEKFNENTKYIFCYVDLCLCDIQMPGLSGYKIAKQIRSSELPLRNIPLIAMSSSIERNAKKCEKVGFNGFLCKPIRWSR